MVCFKMFSGIGSAKNHVTNLHSNAPLIECCMCGYIAKNKNLFSNHINLRHKIMGVKNVVATYGRIVGFNDDNHQIPENQ